MAREKSLWKWLSQARDHELVGDGLHMTRVENTLEEGFPDVEGCWDGGAFWIELKSVARPARETTRVLAPDDIRPKQPPWLTKRWCAGGNAFMLIQVGERSKARRYLIPGNITHLVAGMPECWLHEKSLTAYDFYPDELVRFAAKHRH